MNVKVTGAGLEFVRHASDRRATAGSEDFDLNAKLFLKVLLELFSELYARGNRDNDSFLLSRGGKKFVPFFR